MMLDLMSKVCSFAHLTCNGNACIDIGLLVALVFLVPCVKVYIFGYSNNVIATAGPRSQCAEKMTKHSGPGKSMWDSDV